MAEAVVSFAVERLGYLLVQEARLLGGTGKQIQRLQKELQRMKCFLKDADARRDKHDSVKNWIAEIREAAYDSEDLIELYSVKIAQKKFLHILSNVIGRRRIGSEIEQVMNKLSELTTSLQTYGIRELGSETNSFSIERERQVVLRRTYSHVVNQNIVGLDEDVKKLVNQLVNHQSNCQVVSIFGMGGLGKTTLAKEVYHNSEIRRHFDCFAWAYVSRHEWRSRDIWEGILIKLMSPDITVNQRDEISRMKEEELAKKLYQIQEEKKCLVVLDDIWTVEAWQSLRAGFPNNEKTSSRILLTSRNLKMVKYVDPNGFLHEPRCLSVEEGWILIQKIAVFGRENTGFRFDVEMEELGKKMVTLCSGLPLAISVLGGILIAKFSLHEWDTVYENFKALMRRGKGTHEREDQDQVLEALVLSYDDLPYHLKPCFLYFGIFPKEFRIPIEKLTNMWVAEGIILNEGDTEETVEEIAERRLNELAERCMIQVEKRNSTGKIRTCSIHNLMRDLCVSEAKKENFFQFLNHTCNKNKRMCNYTSMIKARRLGISLNDYSVFEHTPLACKQYRYLRSLVGFYGDGFSFDPLMPSLIQKSVVRNLLLLKVLDLENRWEICRLPKEIGGLVHLRFFNLLVYRLINIPSSIANLTSLFTLKLDCVSKRGETQIPNVIWKIKHLRHLYLPINCRGYKTGNLNLSNLTNLQTLVNFPASYNPSDLLSLTNLRKLNLGSENSIWFEEFKKIFDSSTVSFSKLQSLSIDFRNCESTRLDIGKVGSCCPCLQELSLLGMCSLPDEPQDVFQNLTELVLMESKLQENLMVILGKLPNLISLYLYENVFLGNEMVCAEESFPRLESLQLWDLRNVNEWTVVEGAMSCLRRLKIAACENLKAVPDGLRFVTTLLELEITEMPKEFIEKIEEGGEDFYKVHHVPARIFKES